MGHLGKEKANTPEPEQPQLKMLLIAGDNTGTGIQENLMDSGGVGLICETEADTVSTAIGGDHGHWSDLLRKCFDHDRLAYNRRTNTNTANVTSRSSAYFSAARLHKSSPLSHRPKRIVLSPAVLLYACH